MVVLDKSLADEMIIQHILAGNNRYFSVLSERYDKIIFQRCYHYVKDGELADDLTQEILIKVFVNLKNFRAEAKFTTWLYAIIHHTCIDYLRKQKKRDHEVISGKLADKLPDIVEQELDISAHHSKELLEILLEQVSIEDKLILLLKYQDKKSIREIALSLQLSESAIKMRLMRAREKLKKLVPD